MSAPPFGPMVTADVHSPIGPAVALAGYNSAEITIEAPAFVESSLELVSNRRKILHQLQVQRGNVIAAYTDGRDYRSVTRTGLISGAFYTPYELNSDLYFYAPFKEIRVSYGPKQSLLEIRLWRNRALHASAAFSRKMFFNLLLPYRKAIVSAPILSPMETEMWEARLYEAIDLGCKISMLDTLQHKIVEVESLRKFENLYLPEWQEVSTNGLPSIGNTSRYRWLIQEPSAAS